MILSHGGSITQINSLGQSFEHVVCEAGMVPSLEWVVDLLNGDVIQTLQQTDNRGLTCVHLAAKVRYAQSYMMVNTIHTKRSYIIYHMSC